MTKDLKKIIEAFKKEYKSTNSIFLAEEAALKTINTFSAKEAFEECFAAIAATSKAAGKNPKRIKKHLDYKKYKIRTLGSICFLLTEDGKDKKIYIVTGGKPVSICENIEEDFIVADISDKNGKRLNIQMLGLNSAEQFSFSEEDFLHVISALAMS